MILDALYTTINPVLSAHPLIGDIEAATPFCMFKVTPEILRDKTGIIGYSHLVEIGIVDREITDINTYTTGVTAAILAITGTVNSTIFEGVMHTDESGIYYNDADQVYMNDLEFRIFTKNR
ncbi:MAG: hypothetical protein OEY01_11135 [Desulfobulbaceae bacterium]|nr:hypothetical protein [Desulfobulbaceae bacterium]